MVLYFFAPAGSVAVGYAHQVNNGYGLRPRQVKNPLTAAAHLPIAALVILSWLKKIINKVERVQHIQQESASNHTAPVVLHQGTKGSANCVALLEVPVGSTS